MGHPPTDRRVRDRDPAPNEKFPQSLKLSVYLRYKQTVCSEYQPFHETHKRRLIYCNPDNFGPLIDGSLIGSADTVRLKLRRLLDRGP
jgi:hypothetical protein